MTYGLRAKESFRINPPAAQGILGFGTRQLVLHPTLLIPIHPHYIITPQYKINVTEIVMKTLSMMANNILHQEVKDYQWDIIGTLNIRQLHFLPINVIYLSN